MIAEDAKHLGAAVVKRNAPVGVSAHPPPAAGKLPIGGLVYISPRLVSPRFEGFEGCGATGQERWADPPHLDCCECVECRSAENCRCGLSIMCLMRENRSIPPLSTASQRQVWPLARGRGRPERTTTSTSTSARMGVAIVKRNAPVGVSADPPRPQATADRGVFCLSPLNSREPVVVPVAGQVAAKVFP